MSRLQKNVFLTYFKAVILLAATFCLGYVLATGIAKMVDMGKVTETPVETEDLRDVFVLKNDLATGSELSPEQFIVVQKSKEEIPRGAVKTFQQIEGRTAKTDLPKGTLLIDDYFVSRISKNGQLGYIPPGYHSVTVQVYESGDEQENSIRSVRPGDQVDILVVQNDPETGEKSDEILLLEKIPVLETIAPEVDDIPGLERKGTVALLLSNSQKKHLQDEVNEDMRIRLRICPTEETQTADEAGPQTLRQVVGSGDSDNPQASQSRPLPLAQQMNYGNITIEFANHSQTPAQNATGIQTAEHGLKPLGLNELQLSAFRGVPSENVKLAQNASLDRNMTGNKLVESRPEPRYSSFYDTTGQNGSGEMQWHVVTPYPPVVYEARPGTQTQARGVYREGGVYISAE